MAITKKTKDLAAGLTDDQKTKIRDFGDKIGTEALKDRLGVESPTIEQPSAVETPAPIETPEIETPPIETAPIETPEIETPPIDPIATPDPSLVDQGEQAKQKEQDLATKAIEDAKKAREKSIEDAKRGFALGKGKFDENKANYSNYDEINTKYNAVIDEITASMSDEGVIDPSVYQNIADKYGITIEEAKNPNRILDQVQLTEEGKEATGVNAFESGIEDLTKDNERRKEDLNLQLEQAREGYGNQMSNALESVNDVITGLTSSGAASGLFRSTALSDRVQDAKESGDKTFSRIAAASNRTEGQIHESLTRITDDFNQSVEEARKDFDDNFKQVHNENIVNLQAAGLNFTGDKLIEEIKRINEEFGIESQSISTNYLNNVSKINQIVQDNITIAEQLADQEEQRELKSYNEYLENDGILLQSSTLSEITQKVQEGALSVESAQNLRKIMQTSIQSTLGALAPLELGDIDNINYLLEQGYTPEQAIALMQESFDKFQPKEEVTITQDWTKLDDDTLFNKKTGETKAVSEASASSSSGVKGLLDQISTAEGTHGNYNAVYGNGAQNEVDLTNMTLNELQKFQADSVYQDSNGNYVGGAMGKYQIVTGTLKGLISQMGLTGDEKFTPELQDRMAVHLLGTTLEDYKNGNINEQDLQRKLSQVWASVPNPDTGESTYASDGTNAATQGGRDILSAIQGLKGESDEILGVTGAPLSFERQIKQKVPSTLQNSDGEREQLNETIKIMSDAGFTAEEAALTFMGFDIDIRDRDKVDEFINIGRNLGDASPEGFLPTISNYINSDDYEGAEVYISNIVEDKAKSRYGGDFIPESTMDSATRNITEIISLIESNKDKIGAVDGRIKKLMKKYGEDEQIQRLQTLMTGTFADLRKNFAGSAVTETELQALADYIAGDIKEQPDNLITKLETLLTKQTNEFVDQRQQFGYTPSDYSVEEFGSTEVDQSDAVTEEDDIDTLTEYYFPTN